MRLLCKGKDNMSRITINLPDLPIEANIKDEELRRIVKQYNMVLQRLMTDLYGDISELNERISALE
ncbi:MAG: hypothetical protein XE08_0630 [Parcubacteria bacterium 32_520]|nr:MAG: hypothetical protein XE08_0630 [Parcubacteria bacterium 32_520]